MPVSDAQIQAALPHLGFTRDDLRNVLKLPSLEAATAALEALKQRIHRNFRKAARELHPDLNGGDTGKTETYMSLAAVVEEIDKLRITPRPPPRPVFVSPFGATTTSTTVTWTGNNIRITVR